MSSWGESHWDEPDPKSMENVKELKEQVATPIREHSQDNGEFFRRREIKKTQKEIKEKLRAIKYIGRQEFDFHNVYYHPECEIVIKKGDIKYATELVRERIENKISEENEENTKDIR